MSGLQKLLPCRLPHVVLLLVIALRCFLHIQLYHAGFAAFTADEFGRTLIAAEWSRNPVFLTSGFWLPFPTYAVGMPLMLHWDLLWVPRAVSLVAGVLSIGAMYLLATSIAGDTRAGLISALLLAVNPAHVWLSSTALAEVPNMLFVLAGVWQLCVVVRGGHVCHALLGALLLSVANGFRFESWLISGLWAGVLAWMGLAALRGRRWQAAAALWAAAMLCCLGPLIWMLGNAIQLGNPLYFASFTKSYNARWYGDEKFYGKYAQLFFQLDALSTLIIVPCGLWLLVRLRHARAAAIYTCCIVLMTCAYLLLQNGQLEPINNDLRYLSQIMVLFYPIIGCAAAPVVQRIVRPGWQRLALAALAALVLCAQVPRVFQLPVEPAGAGLAVGQQISELRHTHADLAGRPVVMELSYWQYLAIHVGASDIDTIIYDRPLDHQNRRSVSLLQADPRLFQHCVAAYDVSYVVVKDPDLATRAADMLQTPASAVVSGYSFFAVDAAKLPRAAEAQREGCPAFFAPGRRTQ